MLTPLLVIAGYSYSTTVWVFAALISIPPVALLRFVFVVVAFALSGFFLLRKCVLLTGPSRSAQSLIPNIVPRSIYPILSTAQSKAARILILAVAFLHFVFSVVLYFYFLNSGDIGTSPVVPRPGAGDGKGSKPTPSDGATDA